jgi:type 1 glutamine amidotransferase
MIHMSRSVATVLLGGLCVVLMNVPLWAQSPEKLRDLTAEEIARITEAMPTKAAVTPEKPRKILVFWRCEGFFHTVIPVVNEALKIMGEKTGAFEVTLTNDYAVFTPEALKPFDAICLNNTTTLKLDPHRTPEACAAIMDFVKGGKGLIGIHAAADSFYATDKSPYDWPEAQEMIGNRFTGHPWTSGSTVAIKIDEPNNPLTEPFHGRGFKIKDEIYRTAPPVYSRDKQEVLMSLDMSDPNTRNVNGFKETDVDTGISWIKSWGQGRVFYCSLGHNDEIFMTAPILEYYLRGIQFALGDLKVSVSPKATGDSTGGHSNGTTHSDDRLKITFVVPEAIDLYTPEHPGPLASQLSSRVPFIFVNPRFTEENVNVRVADNVSESDVVALKGYLDEQGTFPLPEYKRVSVALIEIGKDHKKQAVEHIFFMRGNIMGKLRSVAFSHNGRGFTFTCATSPERFEQTNKDFFDSLFESMTFQ